YESCATPNNIIDPGETVTVSFALTNIGDADTTNLTVTLLETNGVMSPSAPQIYGVVPAGGAAVQGAFTFVASGTCGGIISTVRQIQDGGIKFGELTPTIPLGAIVTDTMRVTNDNFISIPTMGSSPTYPSTIEISGVTGTVTRVTVTLHEFT